MHMHQESPRCYLEVNAQNADVQQRKDGSHHQDEQRDSTAVAKLIELERLAVLVDGQKFCIEVTSSCQDKDQGEIGERRQRDEEEVCSNTAFDQWERNMPNACPQTSTINRGRFEQFSWNAF